MGMRFKWMAAGLILCSSVFGHPVAWKGAWSLMSSASNDSFDLQVFNTFHRFLAGGVEYQRTSMFGADNQMVIPRLNLRAMRWNGLDYQGNIYLFGGYGVQWSPTDRTGAAFVGAEADYETRDVYFSGKGSTVLSQNFPDMTMYQLRAGVAPYRGNYNDLSTWVIVQGQYFPTAPMEQFRIGPMLRFYIKNVLWEFGVNTKSLWNFNFMVHF